MKKKLKRTIREKLKWTPAGFEPGLPGYWLYARPSGHSEMSTTGCQIVNLHLQIGIIFQFLMEWIEMI